MPVVNLSLLLPEFLVAALAFAVFAADLFMRPRQRNVLSVVSAVGLVAIGVFTYWFLQGKSESLYNGVLKIDNYSLFFKVFFLAMGVMIVIASASFVKQYLSHPGEYYGILLFSVVGMMLMSGAGELLTAYISLELLSFSLYIMASYARDNPKSNEAGIKYVLLGALSSAILLYGISMIYGATGTTTFSDIAAALRNLDAVNPRLLIGMALVLAGLGFKLAAVPFHMWAPDVYEGAPLPVTAYIAIGSKVAAFALMLRLFGEAFLPAIDQWRMLVAILAALTMSVGNLVALAQTNMKRLLAYSSIAHVGYLLIGIAALSPMASTGLMFYLVGYSATNMLLFAAVIAFYNKEPRDDISALAGLADRSPFLAGAMAAALFSLSGLPFFAGFIVKFYLFSAATHEGLLWLAGLAIFNSLVSLYYYLMIIKQMYINQSPDKTPIRVSGGMAALVIALVIAVFVIGLYPAPFVDVIESATRTIFPATMMASY
ncbi:MAG: NADH-quinone oxidoreductase subunit N [Dehalococcoidia bacterium]|nr:NADH-quinone oxidoreductase subunit N [Dehalococcoidia bacterium]